MNYGRTLYQLGFQISPILLQNGIASKIPGKLLPIVALTQPGSTTASILSGNFSDTVNLDKYAAHFQVMPGGQFISNQIGNYPFANQTVAANALIAQPLSVSVRMALPINESNKPLTRLSSFTALKAALDLHNQSGGTYMVAMPTYIWTDLVMTSLTDASEGTPTQPQTAFIFQFTKPLLTESQAQTVYNTLMDKIANGLPTSAAPSTSGADATIGGALSSAYDSVASWAKSLIGNQATGG